MAIDIKSSGNYYIAEGTRQEVLDHVSGISGPFAVITYTRNFGLDNCSVMYQKS